MDMTTSNHHTRQKSPYAVATGFTTAYLGDERSLREFIVGDYVKNQIARKGENVVLYLINDSYDPLKDRQLRVGVNKDEKLFRQFEKYCGRPIAEIPDPFGCHETYSQHFTEALLKRLRSLDIHPVILNSYQAYRSGYYADFVSTTFENYSRIREILADRFDSYTLQNLFHAQCPKCLTIDATHIRKVTGVDIRIECERCGIETIQRIDEIQGKLSWKLDCAARWNIYGIDMETFSKSHLAGLGSYEISKFISEHFYEGQVPVPVKYGEVQISKEMSHKLLEILPPEILKKLFTTHITRDIEINKNSVEHFCHKSFIRSGVSYVDYVRTELSKRAICEENWNGSNRKRGTMPATSIEDRELIPFANEFSRFYYDKEYGVRFPDAEAIAAVDPATAKVARDVILYSLSIRHVSEQKNEDINRLIKSYLKDRQDVSSKVYHYLRHIFGQGKGPHISTLLALLPKAYLNLIQTILGYYAGEHLSFGEHPEGLENFNNAVGQLL